MHEHKNNSERGQSSPAKLTIILILLPILVVALMVVFWVIYQETRDHEKVSQNQTSALHRSDQLLGQITLNPTSKEST